jgi:predicted nucleic-acid-binding protein
MLLRLLLRDDLAQHRAIARLYDQARHKLLVADLAISEMAFVLQSHYKFSREQVAEAINGLVSLPKISCSQELMKESLALYTRHPKLSFEDCYLALYAKVNQAEPLWTFDKKLANQAPSAKLVV